MNSDNQPNIIQTVIGDHNIFSATGDVYHTVYQLSPAQGEDRANLLILLNKVRQFWVQGVLEQSVHHAVLLELGKETRPQDVEHPWDMDLEVPGRDKPQRLPPGAKISAVFEQTVRLLLILGEPGSGKTITLLELARDLLNQAEHDPTQPIPTVFNLSSWAEKRAPLKDWLVEELKSKYLIPKKIARAWLDNLRILPLLDGLDEVKAEHRAACLDAVNAFAQEGIPGMAVCSRLQDYLALPRRLKLNGAICLQALTQAQIDEYLKNAGEGLEALHKLLQEDEGLRELTQTPLMLNIMVMAYQESSVNKSETKKSRIFQFFNSHFSDDELSKKRKFLFNLYIEKSFRRKGLRRRAYDKDNTLKWISWLAYNLKLREKITFALDDLQPTWFDNRLDKILYKIISTFFVSLIFTVLCFFIALFYVGVNESLNIAFTFFIFIFFMFLQWIETGTIESKDIIVWSWKRFLVNSYYILTKGFKYFLISYFLLGIFKEYTISLIIIFGLVGMFKGAMEAGFEVKLIERTYGNQGIFLTTKNSILYTFIFTLLSIVFTTFIMLYLTHGNLDYSLHLLLSFSIGFTINFFFFGGFEPIKHYSLRILFFIHRNMPLQYIRFLGYCNNLIFLNKVGGSYIFIHRYLLEHFATLYEEAEQAKRGMKKEEKA